MSRYFWFFNLWWEIWLILCCTNKVLGYPKNLHLLSQYIGSLFLKDHIHHFLYNQLQPDLEIFGIDIDINLCPDISLTLHIQIYYSASTVYHAPSDLLGIGGMHHEYIRAAPNWQKKGMPWYNCVFVEHDPENEGFRSLGIVQGQMFFTFRHDDILYSCALVHWFETYGDHPCLETGMWRVKPDFDQQQQRVCSVIYIDSILRAAHLLVFGKNFIPEKLQFYQSLCAFQLYYVNKYADHHSHEVAF